MPPPFQLSSFFLDGAATAAAGPSRDVQMEARIAELGHTLPSMPSALGLYVPAVRMGNVIHTAGHIPFDDPLCATSLSNPLAPAVS